MTAQRPLPKPLQVTPDFGKNVLILDIAESREILKEKVRRMRQISKIQTEDGSEFGQDRHAILFKMGTYDLNDLNVDVGYYMTVHGLGDEPDKVVINGQVRSPGSSNPDTVGLALNNFWRGVENLAVNPIDATKNPTPNVWAVSQATFMRRVHVMGKDSTVWLWDLAPYWNPGDKKTGPHWDKKAGYSSGGFIADSFFDGTVIGASQQQFLTRNVSFINKDNRGWKGGAWNIVFVGDEGPPEGSWAELIREGKQTPYTKIGETPVIREKPYLTCGDDGKYSVQVPPLHRNTIGLSWLKDKGRGQNISISQFFVAIAGTFAATASELNKRLSEGYHLILTPGVYHLDQSLVVNYPNTVILGLGMATLVPDYGSPAMIIADVDGVSVSGLIFDAGPLESSSLLIVGYNVLRGLPGADHKDNPTAVFDCSARVGGGGRAAALNCFTIHSNDVILDNVWLWRADHGRMGTHDPSVIGWDINPAQNGLTVNGDRVVAYGLFVEHFQGYQTVWNGNQGKVYFYQSEIPYDVPDQTKWRWQETQKGFASYKVSDQVTSHTAWGLGVYCNFWYYNVQLDNAIEVPNGYAIEAPDGPKDPKPIDMNNMCTVWLGGADGSGINYVVNGTHPFPFPDGWEIKDKGRAVLTKAQVSKPSQVLKLEFK